MQYNRLLAVIGILSLVTVAQLVLVSCRLVADRVAVGKTYGSASVSVHDGSEPQDMFTAFSTTLHPMYLFLAPITALAWKHSAVRHTPIVQLVTRASGLLTADDVALREFVAAKCREAGAVVDVLKAPAGYPASDVTTLAQVARLFSPLTSPQLLRRTREQVDRAVFVTSDADMAPLSRAYFVDEVAEGRWPDPMVHLLYSNAYARPHSPLTMYRVPLCYVAATGASWRFLMRYSQGDNCTVLSEAMRHINRARALYGSNWTYDRFRVRWSFDETLLGTSLAQSRLCPAPESCRQRPRTGTTRLNRGKNWRVNGTASLRGLLDCHLWRPGWYAGQWAEIMKLYALIIDDWEPKWRQWSESYRDEYIRLCRLNVTAAPFL
eukprot:m51a1_g11498 hypothetical protein (379) ;mRNA; r:9196-10440